jgi:hypothetical protein
MLIGETSFLLVMSHGDRGWVGFALDPFLQTKGGPFVMAGSFKVKVFFTMIG